jgi:hypothetical protein
LVIDVGVVGVVERHILVLYHVGTKVESEINVLLLHAWHTDHVDVVALLHVIR